ncbi:MAG TPA: flagellar hook-basal body complex protein FliE [Tepidisphaeraceae bacterium]|nr:flagellar hook-basal body complex protein FliE [Tepidisphaeraceae bacterium]
MTNIFLVTVHSSLIIVFSISALSTKLPMIPISPNNLSIGNLTGVGNAGAGPTGAPASGASFADALKNSVDEVSRLQQDATKAVEDVATGKTENVDGVMTAVEKSDLAFKTLLAIRAKLMDAYDEIKGMAI